MKILICGKAEDTVNYANAVSSCGADCDTSIAINDYSSYDGLILPGGGDVHPSRFGETNNGSRAIDEEMDEIQFNALDYFVNAKKPVLGICRGEQLINIYFGGKIIQDLPTNFLHQYSEETGIIYHDVKADRGSIIYRLYGEDFVVNSYHHQGCSLMGSGLRATAFADDGVVEAIEHKSLPIVGTQWHPERLAFDKYIPGKSDGSLIFNEFLNSYNLN